MTDGLAGREDSEHEQAAIRLVLGALACAYLLYLDLPAARMLLWMVGVFLTGSLLLLIAVVLRPAPSPLRRYLGMCLDLFAVSAAMGAAGEAGAPLLAIYLWVIVGNGFRYGLRYLWVATGLGILGFGGVYLFSDFWGRHPVFSVSFLIVLVLIPGYVAALLDKLNQAIARANEASQAKSRFLAKMSHELRTPLNGVIGMADLLMDSHLLPRQEGFARTIQTSARTLLGIIEHVLDFSKIEAGRIAIENVDLDLHRLAADTLQMFQPQAQRKGLRLLQQIDPRVPFRLRGDPLHVRQILMNLIANAVKFTDRGWVKLSVGIARAARPDGRIDIRFEVEDTGIGIPHDEQRHIFESFRQARGTGSRRDGGTGLGTAIARELAGLMGGAIGLSSEPGKGTLFWVELPFLPQPADDPKAERDLQGARVLVVGDGLQAESLDGILRQWGIECARARTSAAALADLLAAAEAERPYSVLVAAANGLEPDPRRLAAAARSEPALAGLGLILVGASPALGSEASLLAAGYAGVLGEPLDKTLLFNAIHFARSAQERPDNVVSLAERYSQLSARPKRGLRILVAEDNATNRLVLQGILERVGHRPILVTDGEAALDLLERDAAALDLMILDKNMPGRSGLDVFKAHRFMTRAPVPAILLTADATPDALAECNDAGVDAYLTKPVDTLKLLETIARLADSGARPPEIGAAGEGEEPGGEAGALIDEDKLRSLLGLGGDSSFYDDLVGVFLRDSGLALQAISQALAERDYPALRAAIHALRGSASELGAAGMVALCVELRSLKPFELDSLRAGELLAKLRRTHEATAEALHAFPASSEGTAPSTLVEGPWARPGSDG